MTVGNPNLIDTIAEWIRLGGKVTKPRRNGEFFFRHKRFPKLIAVSRGRKDTPRELAARLRQLQRAEAQ